MSSASSARTSRTASIVSACSYGLISISITLFNKAVLSTYAFHLTLAMSLSQIVCSLVILTVLKRLGLIAFQDFSWETARVVRPLVLAFILMLVTGLLLLESTSVALFGSFRRLSTVVVVIAEHFFMGITPGPLVWLTIVMMAVAAIVAGWGDAVLIDLYGIALLLAGSVSLAVYLVLASKARASTGLNIFGLLFYCNLFALPIMFVWIVAIGEHRLVAEHPAIWMPGFQFAFLMSSVQAMMLNYAIFWCTQVNSPLTTNIMGQIKNVVVTVLGVIIFGDFQPTTVNVSGLILGTVASAIYVYAKYLDSNKLVDEDTGKKLNEKV
jgi:solute carrier family 35 protein